MPEQSQLLERVRAREVTKNSRHQEYPISDVTGGVNQFFEDDEVPPPGKIIDEQEQRNIEDRYVHLRGDNNHGQDFLGSQA